MKDIFRRLLGGAPRDQAEPAAVAREADRFPPHPPAPPVIDVEPPPAAPAPARPSADAVRLDRSIASALLVAGAPAGGDDETEAQAYLRWRRMRARMGRTDHPAPAARTGEPDC